MAWQLDIRLYRNWNLHTNTHYTQSRNADVVNINNLRIKYKNNNTLDLITIGSVIYGNAFFLSWAEQMWQTCYLFRWQYTVKVIIWVIYSKP